MKNSFYLFVCALLVVSFSFYGCAAPAKKKDVAAETLVEEVVVDDDTGKPRDPSKRPTKRPDATTDADLEDVFFDYDRYSIKPGAREALKNNAEILKNDPSLMIKIEGHCDERGSNEYNIALGERRAKAVKKYLTNLGVDSRRIDWVSYGEEKPFCRAHNEGCWSKNRRGHIVTR